MYSILKIVYIIVICSILLFTAVGLLTGSETAFSHTEIINSPVTVVWRTMTNTERMPQWNEGLRRDEARRPLRKGSVIRCYRTSYGKGLFHEEKVDILNPESRISFIRVDKAPRPLLKNYFRYFELKKLRDGSTEVTYRLSYRSNSFLTRVFDKLYLSHALKSSSGRSLRNLKRIIEKV